MADEEHRSLKEIDHDLAERAEQLEKDIEAAEARHGPGVQPAALEDKTSPDPLGGKEIRARATRG